MDVLGGGAALAGQAADARYVQFHYFLPSMGLLGLGILAAPLFLATDRRVRRALIAALVAILAWTLILFDPGQFNVHVGSFFPQATIIVATVVGLFIRWWLAVPLAVLHCLATLIVYAL